jgi:hypothetical protein
MRRALARFANLFRRRRAERDMTREIEAHLGLLRESLEHRGLTPQEAAREARIVYGGVDRAKELHREARSFAAAIALDAWDRSTDLVPDTMLHSMFGDPIIYGEIVFMLAVALLASALPARGATQVDPVLALRHD